MMPAARGNRPHFRFGEVHAVGADSARKFFVARDHKKQRPLRNKSGQRLGQHGTFLRVAMTQDNSGALRQGLRYRNRIRNPHIVGDQKKRRQMHRGASIETLSRAC